ncbi:MAG: hypothetical protein GXO42_02160 [bacterium]|nr:hypothetical protein [bacterium]
MELELNNQALAYMQAFELTTKARVARIEINEDSVIFYVDPRQRINPRLLRQFIRQYKRIIKKKIYVVPAASTPKKFILAYLQGLVNLKPSDVVVARGIAMIRVPAHLRRKIIGKNGSRIRELEKLLKNTFRNISKVIVVAEHSEGNNVGQKSS